MVDHEQILRDIGARIREARKAAQMSQEVLADKSGIPRTSLSAIETAKQADVGITVLLGLGEALGTTLAHLVFGESLVSEVTETAPVIPGPPQPLNEATITARDFTVILKAGEPVTALANEALRVLREVAPAAGPERTGPIL
jgi:transcriptional regulator with XRE-family HTH domain